jgi:hypothetical protein
MPSVPANSSLKSRSTIRAGEIERMCASVRVVPVRPLLASVTIPNSARPAVAMTTNEGLAKTLCPASRAAPGIETLIVSGTEMSYVGHVGSVTVTTVVCSRLTLSFCSRGATTAFHPLGSLDDERTPLSKASVAAGLTYRCPTNASHVSLTVVSSNVRVPAAAMRTSSSVRRSSARPETSTAPLEARIRKAGATKTRLPLLTDELGSVSVMVSGESISYVG